jgi:hypothetical protein
MESDMDSLTAYRMGEASRDRGLMVFDWEKAARLIVESGAKYASAGLCADWEWTGGAILVNGRPLDRGETDVYLASTWAEPELELSGDRVDCWRMQSETPGWDAHTIWPKEALDLLSKEEPE